jgi:hypothetical protein
LIKFYDVYEFIMTTPMPNGLCWCDCGGKTKPGSYFLQGHDKRADRYLEAIDGSQSIADKLIRCSVPGCAP